MCFTCQSFVVKQVSFPLSSDRCDSLLRVNSLQTVLIIFFQTKIVIIQFLAQMFQRQFQICLLVQIGPYTVTGPSRKLRLLKKYYILLQNSAQNTTPHWRFGDMYRRPGLLTITWVNWKFGWKIKWFVPFYLGSVRNYRLSFQAMQFLYFFWSVQLIQIYFLGYSSTRSTLNGVNRQV